jgi:hypothetical protein
MVNAAGFALLTHEKRERLTTGQSRLQQLGLIHSPARSASANDKWLWPTRFVRVEKEMKYFSTFFENFVTSHSKRRLSKLARLFFRLETTKRCAENFHFEESAARNRYGLQAILRRGCERLSERTRCCESARRSLSPMTCLPLSFVCSLSRPSSAASLISTFINYIILFLFQTQRALR